MSMSVADKLRETLLYLAGSPDHGQCLAETLHAVVFALARSTGQTPRQVSDRLTEIVPSDEEWRLELLPQLEARDPQTRANFLAAARVSTPSTPLTRDHFH
jgi:hypothetical protein